MSQRRCAHERRRPRLHAGPSSRVLVFRWPLASSPPTPPVRAPVARRARPCARPDGLVAPAVPSAARRPPCKLSTGVWLNGAGKSAAAEEYHQKVTPPAYMYFRGGYAKKNLLPPTCAAPGRSGGTCWPTRPQHTFLARRRANSQCGALRGARTPSRLCCPHAHRCAPLLLAPLTDSMVPGSATASQTVSQSSRRTNPKVPLRRFLSRRPVPPTAALLPR